MEIYEKIRQSEAIKVYIQRADESLAALGYTNIVEFGGINDWPGETISDGE